MLPLFLPKALVIAIIQMRHFDVLLLGDGILGIVGAIVKALYGTNKKVICINHGLDLTFKNYFYQKFWVGKFIPACDKLIAVGNQTISEGIARGIPKEKFTFVPNGVDVEKFVPKKSDRAVLALLIKQDLTGKKILMTGGRLVTRKGVAWFIRNVLPILPKNVIYIISGEGPSRKNIEAAITDTRLNDRVIMLGYVSNEDRMILLRNCDLFIQPNIPVDGDMEGFGLVVLEAASSGTPVVAARLEGLKDAIHEGKNGFLVEHSNADQWIRRLTELLSDSFDRAQFGHAAHDYVAKHFTWDIVAKQYLAAI